MNAAATTVDSSCRRRFVPHEFSAAHHHFANLYATRVMPPRQYGFDIFPFRTGGFHAT